MVELTDYVKTAWVNGSTNPINATNLLNIENNLDVLEQYVRESASKKVRAATTANITLSGVQTIDGVSLSTGQRCFVRAQSNAAQNGIYLVAAGAWTRTGDADSGAEFHGGTLISVAEGTTLGGKLYRCTNTGAVTINTTALTFTEVGAATGGGGTTYTTDGTTPLKYSAFLVASSGNQTAALQNAINIMFGSSAYNAVLDLEGAVVTITAPIVIPVANSAGVKSIINGEIVAGGGFSGGLHMISGENVQNLYHMRLFNLTMNGANLASWIKWDIGNYVIMGCQFKNPAKGTTAQTAYDRAGLYCSDGGIGSNADSGFWINNCWFSTDDGAVDPISRWTVGILSQTGDNKISGGTTMSYFRHSAIFEAPGVILSNFHPFQGKTPVGADMTNHTASLKFTNGRCGAQVSGLYLGKSFMEISNESNTSQRDIGEIAITNMRAFAQNGESGFAHIQVRDYSGLSDGGAKVSDITLMNSKFINGGTTLSTPTKLYNSAAFDRTGYHGITMSGNTFESTGGTYDVSPQANPATLRRNFTGNTADKVFSTTGFLPFGGRPRRLIEAMANPTGGTDTTPQPLCEGAISADDVTVRADNGWIGDLTVVVTCNSDFGVFVEG